MKIKYSPIKFNEYAKRNAEPETRIKILDENTIEIDSKEYEFDTESVVWDDIVTQTDGVILDARRDNSGELYITVRRFYTKDCASWDTGNYHDVEVGNVS